jgi:hypothetical protein
MQYRVSCYWRGIVVLQEVLRTSCLGFHVMGYKVRKVVFDLLYSITFVLHEFCGNVPLGVIDQYDVVMIPINRSNIVLTP